MGVRLRHAAAEVAAGGDIDRPGTVVTLDGAASRPLDVIADHTACVIAELLLWSWPQSAVDELAERLNPGRVLFFVEPTADVGWRQASHVLGRKWSRARFGYEFSRDVPSAIRASGLIVGDLDRIGLGPVSLRSYVWGRAEPIDPPSTGDSTARS